MTFRDQILERHVHEASGVVTGLPDDLLLVYGLLDAFDWFRVTEGEDAPRTAEAIEHLLSQEVRPALRQWYKIYGKNMNDNAIRFRERLSKLAGEKLG